MIIAIDGPSGAGKSTLGKRLATELGLLYLDTGAMYRAAALAVLDRNGNIYDVDETTATVIKTNVELSGSPDNLHVFLNGLEISGKIRTPEVSQAASLISTLPAVRRILVERQKQLGLNAPHGCVLDGRDIGTVVFPNADVKFFLTAAPESRAARRFAELKEKHVETTLKETLHDIIERDTRDSSRHDSPLKIADDAIVIDSTALSTEQVFETMLAVVRERQKSVSALQS
ncbi:MAG: (d)CMP kinase [Pyrinomonadaceae bacterium]